MSNQPDKQFDETVSSLISNNPPTCVGCHGNRLVEFFRTEASPVNCGSIPRDRDEAVNATVGEIQLVYCLNCELVHNQVFDFRKVDFQPGYEVALTHSKTFLEFQTGVVSELVSKYDLHEKEILEIGCGDGTFLKMICNAGRNKGVGIDPTVPVTGSQPLDSGTVRFIRDYFDEKYVNEIGDFICCLSAFEDIPAPLEFLLMLRRMIGDRQLNLYFEVFNGFRSIETGEIWSIHYEQCNYFSPATMAHLFERAGFKITNSGTCYQDDQYAFVEAVPLSDFVASSELAASDAQSFNKNPPILICQFAEQFQQRSEYWRTRLAELKSNGQRVAIWGSGGKGISFLNAVNATDEIQFVVDINPNRQGCYIPGTAQLIVDPHFMIEFQPDLIILTNPIYEAEIRQLVASMNLECQFDSV